ncbi:hypothetical protein C8Q76DRAFT_698164 [Earliella scabrosa]|nr:hypothetical protein C8Q76DRAFT_698164 [Earliella scabrosa]
MPREPRLMHTALPVPLVVARWKLLAERLPVDIIVHVIWKSDFILLLSWRKTCRAFFTVVATVLRSRYETAVRPFLGPLVSDFGELMRRTGAVLSGSVALQFFVQNSAWVAKDLDIYVPDGSFEQFVTTAEEAFSFESTPNASPSGPPPMEHIANGIRDIRTYTTSTGRRVDVIRSPVNNPIFPLQFYWTTLVMNVVTPDGCVCGYPTYTLQGKGLVRGGLLTDKERAAMAKYENRGFQLTQRDWWQVMEGPSNWTMDYFGDITALGASFKNAVTDPYPSFPLVNTRRGWHDKPGSRDLVVTFKSSTALSKNTRLFLIRASVGPHIPGEISTRKATMVHPTRLEKRYYLHRQCNSSSTYISTCADGPPTSPKSSLVLLVLQRKVDLHGIFTVCTTGTPSNVVTFVIEDFETDHAQLRSDTRTDADNDQHTSKMSLGLSQLRRLEVGVSYGRTIPSGTPIRYQPAQTHEDTQPRDRLRTPPIMTTEAVDRFVHETHFSGAAIVQEGSDMREIEAQSSHDNKTFEFVYEEDPAHNEVEIDLARAHPSQAQASRRQKVSQMSKSNTNFIANPPSSSKPTAKQRTQGDPTHTKYRFYAFAAPSPNDTSPQLRSMYVTGRIRDYTYAQ